MAKPSGNVPATVLIGAAAAGVPATVIASFDKWQAVLSNLTLSSVAWLLGSALLFVAFRLIYGILTELIDKTSRDSASALRAAMAATFRPGYLNRYRRQLSLEARELDQRGVETRDVFGPLLDDIYVEVSLDRGWAESQGKSLAALWKAGKRETLEYFLTGKKHEEKSHQIFIVTGQPGSGKTAMLRNSARLRCQSRSATNDRLPVLLYLRDHTESIMADEHYELSLADLAAGTSSMYGIPAHWLRWRMEHRNCLVLLDGLDEVGDAASRAKVAKWLRHQTRNTRHQYVITSRPGGFVDTELDAIAVPLHMRAFTVPQTVKFLRNWYSAVERRSAADAGDWIKLRAERKANDLHDQFRKRPALYDLASRPLLLAMIANVHYFRRKLPDGRADLYREMCDMLLKRRTIDSVSDGGSGRLSQPQKSMLIRRLALHMKLSQRTSIAVRDAQQVVSDAMARIPHPVPPTTFLSEMVHDGLLVLNRNDYYEFPHVTIQEYLVSEALNDDSAAKFLATKVADSSWHEVIRLWTAASDASEIVAACLESNSDAALWLAFECAKAPRELDPKLREQLDQMRAEGNVPTLVKINDNLHDVVQLGEDMIVCARPVGPTLYAEFLLDRATNGVTPAPDVLPRRPSSKKPVVGMWRSEARALVNWVNENTADDTSYRLPTVNELYDPSIDRVVNLAAHPVWADGEPHPELVCRATVRHTYQVSDARLRDYVAADRKETSAYLIVALGFLRAAAMPGDFKTNFDGVFMFNEAFAFARLIDSGADPDPVVAKALSRMLSWYNVVHPEQIISSDVDVDSLLANIPFTDGVQQLQRLSALPAEFGPREFATIRSYVLLLVPWLRMAKRVHGDQALMDLDKFLLTQAVTFDNEQPGYPDRILPSLSTAQDAMRKYQLVDTLAAEMPPGMASKVVASVRQFMAPALDRTGPYNVDDVRCARLGVAASVALLRQLSGMEQTALLLHACLRSLVVLQARTDNDIIPTELLLLARA